MSMDTQHWWHNATIDEVRACESVVHNFLTAPRPDANDEFARALAFYILLGGDEIAISQKIDHIRDFQQADYACGALQSCEAKLSDCQASMTAALKDSIKRLEGYYRAKIEEAKSRMARDAKQFKIKLKGKGLVP